MGDDHHRHALARQFQNDVENLAHHLGVERGGDLVEKKDLGLHHERPNDGHALLLPARKLAGEGLRLVQQAHAFEQLAGAPGRFGPFLAQNLRRAQQEVLQHVQMREELVALEHHPDPLPQKIPRQRLARNLLAVELNDAALDRLQAVERAQKRRLSAAGRPDDDDHFAAGDVEGHPVKGREIAVVDLDDVAHGQGRGRPRLFVG